MKIKHKLLFALLFNLLLIGGLGVGGYVASHHTHLRIDDLIKFPVPSIINISQMNQTFLLAVNDSLSYRITGLPEEKAHYFENVGKFETLLEELKNKLGYGTSEIPAEDALLIDGLMEQWSEFKTRTDFLFLAKESGPEAGVAVLEEAEYIKNIEEIVEMLEDYMRLENREIEAAHIEITSMTDLFMKQSIIAVFLSLLVTLVTNLLVLRSIINPLGKLQEAVERFGKGEWGQRIHHKGKDEFGVLARVFNTMADNIEQSQSTMEERIKERTQELQSKFEEIESMNALMTGRELKMIELKNEIATLKQGRAG